MIKTKKALQVFIIICLIIFPYHITILFINADFLISLIPGWHTTIIPGQLISNLIKFLILVVVTFYYWRLSKITLYLNFKRFLIHLLLTIPAVFIGRFSIYELLDFYSIATENLMTKIQIVIYANSFINVLFVTGQVLFAINYNRAKKIVIFQP